jgi:hypothetical protein
MPTVGRWVVGLSSIGPRAELLSPINKETGIERRWGGGGEGEKVGEKELVERDFKHKLEMV